MAGIKIGGIGPMTPEEIREILQQADQRSSEERRNNEINLIALRSGVVSRRKKSEDAVFRAAKRRWKNSPQFNTEREKLMEGGLSDFLQLLTSRTLHFFPGADGVNPGGGRDELREFLACAGGGSRSRGPYKTARAVEKHFLEMDRDGTLTVRASQKRKPWQERYRITEAKRGPRGRAAEYAVPAWDAMELAARITAGQFAHAARSRTDSRKVMELARHTAKIALMEFLWGVIYDPL